MTQVRFQRGWWDANQVEACPLCFSPLSFQTMSTSSKAASCPQECPGLQISKPSVTSVWPCREWESQWWQMTANRFQYSNKSAGGGGWGTESCSDTHSLTRLIIHKESKCCKSMICWHPPTHPPKKTHFNLEITFMRSLLKISVAYAIHITNNPFEIYFTGHSKVIFIPKVVFRT